MSGLILSALGQGISQAGNTVGAAMTRGYEREQDEQRRARERQEDADLRRELAGVRAGGTGTSRSSGGGSGAVDRDGVELVEGSILEEEAAGAIEEDVPTLRKLRNAQKTGDFSAFEQPMEGSETGRILPKEFIEKKRKMLTTFLAEVRTARGYSDLTQGRKNQQSVDLTEQAIEKPETAGVIGRARAAEKGEGPYKVQGNTKIDQFTGETSTTEVGKSIVDKNKSGPAPKGGGSSKPKEQPTEKLTQEAETIRKAIKDMSPTDPRRAQYQSRLDGVLNELERRRQGGQGSAKPSDNRPAQGKDYSNLWK